MTQDGSPILILSLTFSFAMRSMFVLLAVTLAMSCGNRGEDVSSGDSDRVSSPVSENQSQKVDLDNPYISIDSVKKDLGVIEYLLFLNKGGKKVRVYSVESQDYSVELWEKYSVANDGHDYVCFEIADLPTGLTWNVIYDKKQGEVFVTDKYDVQALGDTLDRHSVDFRARRASIVSDINEERYSVNLNKIWPD